MTALWMHEEIKQIELHNVRRMKFFMRLPGVSWRELFMSSREYNIAMDVEITNFIKGV